MFPCFVMVMCVCAYMTIRNSPQMIGIRQQVASIFLGYNNWWQIAQMHLILKNTQQVHHLHIYGICRSKCSFI